MKFCVKCGAIMRSTSAGIYVCPSCGNIQKDVPAEKPKTDPGVDKSAKSAKPAADKPEARKTPSAPVKKDRPASPTAANTPAAAPAAKAGRAYSLNTDIGAEKEDKAQENIESGDENPEKAAAVTVEKTTEKAAEKAVESEIAAPKPEKTEPAAATDTAPKEAKTTDDHTAAETAPESGDSATSADTNAELEAMRAKLRALEAEKELAETKAKLLEAEKKLNSGRSGGGSFSSALNSVKNSAAVVKARAVANKVGIGRLAFIFVILIAFITLMSCFCGLRGIYVNTNNPNEFYSFNSSHGYEYYYTNPLTGEPAVEKGRWSKSGDVLTLKTEDELFGEVEESFVLKDSSWSKFTLTESFMGVETETSFERVSIIQYKDNAGRVRVTFDANGGVGSRTERIDIGSVCPEPDDEPTREGYLFQGWYTTADGWRTGEGEEFSSTARIWERTTYYANWAEIYDINYVLNGGVNVSGNPSNYTDFDKNISLATPVRGDLVAYTLNLDGTFSVTREPTHTFEGWYLNSDFSGDAITQITSQMSGDITLYAKWSNSSTTSIVTTTENYIRINSSGNGCNRFGYILFGAYPQSEVDDPTTLAALNESYTELPTANSLNGWTSYKYYIEGSNSTDFMWYIDIEYSGEKYRGVYFTSYRSFFATGEDWYYPIDQEYYGYYTGTVYWFKWEPIKWRILSESDGKAMILSELKIDSQQYDYDGSYSNNYADSTIRAWLNDTFYNTAFGAMQQAIIETTEVNNGISSTGETYNPYVGANTFDKIFLLSYKEAATISSHISYGKSPSDYQKAQGAGSYWILRSPYYHGFNVDDRVSTASTTGIDGHVTVYSAYSGIVPALWINL